MPTLEERVQALEKEPAERKHSEEMLTIAVRALVSKEAFEKLQETNEKYQEQNGKLFNVIINQNALHNEQLTDLQGHIIDVNGKLDGKVTVLDGKITTLQTETRQQFTEVRKDTTDLKTDVFNLKSIAQQILARLPEKPWTNCFRLLQTGGETAINKAKSDSKSDSKTERKRHTTTNIRRQTRRGRKSPIRSRSTTS